MSGIIVKMTREQRRLFPVNALLMDWRTHCRDVHEARPEDWRLNVLKWHREHHPDCDLGSRVQP